MDIGPDIAVSLAGVGAIGDGSPRASLDWSRALGVRGVALDGAAAGFRGRELGRSARRDLAASLRRRELELAGIDLWIPADHFADPEHVQRAMETVVQTAELAGELSVLVGGRSLACVSVMTAASIDGQLHAAMGEEAARFGAVVVDHRVDLGEAALAGGAGIAAGVDPAAVLFDGKDPAQAVHQVGAQLGGARLDDVNAMGRCPVGVEGARLDLDGYKASLMIGALAWVTVDLRQLPSSARSFAIARQAWDSGLGIPSLG